MGPTVWSDVRPLAGYWRIPWNHSVFKRCPYIDDCIGYDITIHYFEQMNSTNDGCVLGTEGVLCSQCSPGFNRDVAICMECTPESLPIRVAIVVVAFILLYLFMSCCRNRLKKQWRTYRPLYRDVLRIGSIIVTFSQINTSMPTIIDVPWPPEFVNFLANFNVVNIDLFSLVGVSCVGNFNFYIGFLAMSCLPVCIFLWAMFDLWMARKHMVVRVEHMKEPEKLIQETEALHMLYHITDTDGGGNIEPKELSILLIQLGWHATTSQSYEIMQHFHDDGTKEWSNETGQLVLTEDEFVESMIGNKMNTLLEKFDVLRVGAKRDKKTGEIIHTKESSKETMLCDRDHLIKWVLSKRIMAHSLAGATMLALLAHTPVSRKVFQFFHCNNLAGQNFLIADYSIKCWELGWWAFSPVVFTVMGIFTVGLPGAISHYLYKKRKRLYTADIQQKVGWLYEPFRKGAEVCLLFVVCCLLFVVVFFLVVARVVVYFFSHFLFLFFSSSTFFLIFSFFSSFFLLLFFFFLYSFG